MRLRATAPAQTKAESEKHQHVRGIPEVCDGTGFRGEGGDGADRHPELRIENTARMRKDSAVRPSAPPSARRVVVKLGTGVLTDASKRLDLVQFAQLVAQIARPQAALACSMVTNSPMVAAFNTVPDLSSTSNRRPSGA